MPVMIRYLEGLACPTIVCDWCRQPIEEARDGGYFWPTGPRQESMLVSLTFLHKGRCDQTWAAVYGRLDCWEELRHLPTFLLRNLGMTHLSRTMAL